MEFLLPLMIVYAAFGLALSLAVHVLSFFRIVLGGDTLFFALHVGIFPLWIPVVLIAQKVNGWGRANTSRRDFWKVMLFGCPNWMRYMTYGFFIYAIANFVIFILLGTTGNKTGGGPPPGIWHGFSGHWMAFYSAGLAISTSAYRRGIGNLSPRCPNGHLVGLGDKFCGTCGARLELQPNQSIG